MDEAEYRCFYCGGAIAEPQFEKIESEMKDISSEELEMVYDQLPIPKGHRVAPYLHQGKLDYAVLNICWYCWRKAVKKA